MEDLEARLMAVEELLCFVLAGERPGELDALLDSLLERQRRAPQPHLRHLERLLGEATREQVAYGLRKPRS